MAQLTKAKCHSMVLWNCRERQSLTGLATTTGTFIPLNGIKRPGCYLHRPNPNDVSADETFLRLKLKGGRRTYQTIGCLR